jgi:hypothetical protein
MSVRNILTSGGVISNEYLPTGPAPAHPYVENPFQEDVDGGGYDLSGVGLLNITGALVAQSGAGARVTVNANGGPGNGLVVKPANQTTGNGTICLLNGSSSINPTEYVLYNASASGGGLTAGHMSIYAYTTGGDRLILDTAPDGSLAIFGDGSVVAGCSLEVNGVLGLSRVNDPLYNPAVKISVANFGTIGPSISGGANGVLATTATPGPGLYRLECELTMDNNGTFSIPTGALAFYVALAAGTGALDYSEINITNAMLFQPGAGTANAPSFQSAVFEIPDSVAYAVAYEVSGSAPANNWELGTGGLIKFQLIKVQ